MSNMSNQNKLDFALIGVQKSATSWIYYCLRDHPEISVPDKKLEAGYVGGEMFSNNGADWFFNRFSSTGGRLVGDVSVEYLYDVNSPKLLSQMMKNPKLIVSLRNPVDRLISGYYWLVRRGELPNLPINKGLLPLLDLDQVSNLTAQPLNSIVQRSIYAPQIRNYLKYFPPEAFYVVAYEDIKREPLAVIQNVYQHLNVTQNFCPPSLKSKPKQNTYNEVFMDLENRFPNSKLLAKTINYANQATAVIFNRERTDVVSPNVRAKLNDLFAPGIQETFDILGHLPKSQRPDSHHLYQNWNTR